MSTGVVNRLGEALHPRRIGAVYVLIVLVVIFGSIRPDAFFSRSTFLIILNGGAVSGIVALGVIIPLAAGVFDVSIGYLIALGGTMVAFSVATLDLPGTTAVILTIVAGLIVTLVNIFVVVVMKVPSLIGTLATGLVFLSIITALSKQQQITTNIDRVTQVAGKTFGPIGLPVLVLLGVIIVLTFVLHYTSAGRSWFAIGFDEETARLAGISVNRLQAAALVVSGVLAIIAGILITGRIGAGSPTTGPDYLLPAFTAAFLGATQFTPGRFNVPGTVLAVFVLGTATVGLNLVGAPVWVAQLLQGAILIFAVSIETYSKSLIANSEFLQRRRGRRRVEVEATT